MSIVGMLIALSWRRSQQPFFSISHRHLPFGSLQSWHNSGQLRSLILSGNQLPKLPCCSVSPQILSCLLSGWPWDGKKKALGSLVCESASYIYIYLFICNNELLFYFQGPKTRSLQKQAGLGLLFLFLFLSSFLFLCQPIFLLSVFEIIKRVVLYNKLRRDTSSNNVDLK